MKKYVKISKSKKKYGNLSEFSRKILTIDQAAELLQVCSKTIYGYLSEKREPGKIYAKKIGRIWRIQEEDIIRFLSEEKKES